MEKPPVRNRGFFQPRPLDTNSRPVTTDEQTDLTSSSPPPRTFFKTGHNEETGNSALLGLFLYSAILFAFPLFVYFGAKQVMEDSFDFEPPMSTLAPAIMAIGAVNLVIVAYVVKAFKEESIRAKNKTQ